MERSLHDTYQAIEATHWWFVGRRALIRRLIARYGPARAQVRLLDIGCNSGLFVGNLQQAGYAASGCDTDAVAIWAGNDNGVAKLRVAAFPALGYDTGAFNVLTCLDVLEHVEDDGAALREMDRILAVGGTAIITVPAFPSLWSLQDEVAHHFRRYTRRELLEKITAHTGWRIERVSHFNFFLFLPIWLVRTISNRKKQVRRQSDFEINSRSINAILTLLFLTELWLLRFVSYPCGVSLLVVAKKR